MKFFSNSTTYAILPYDVWETNVRFYESHDFTILPLLPYAILEIIFRLADFSYFADCTIISAHA